MSIVKLQIVTSSILTASGIGMMIYAIFQGYFHTEELSFYVETLRVDGIRGLDGVGNGISWLSALLMELIAGFFLALIGRRIVKR